jgi:threonine-phosphate decarboxylase
MRRILDRCQICGAILVADECFMDFVTGGEAHSLMAFTDSYRELVVLKAFTKLYAMPGIRLGYAVCGDTELINTIYSVRQPWSVSTIAQAMGIAALDMEDIIPRTRAFVDRERAFLVRELSALGLKSFLSQTNYILVKSDKGLYDALLEHDILIRDCSNYRGLTEGFYRLAVKSNADNRLLISALKEVLKNG